METATQTNTGSGPQHERRRLGLRRGWAWFWLVVLAIAGIGFGLRAIGEPTQRQLEWAITWLMVAGLSYGLALLLDRSERQLDTWADAKLAPFGLASLLLLAGGWLVFISVLERQTHEGLGLAAFFGAVGVAVFGPASSSTTSGWSPATRTARRSGPTSTRPGCCAAIPMPPPPGTESSSPPASPAEL